MALRGVRSLNKGKTKTKGERVGRWHPINLCHRCTLTTTVIFGGDRSDETSTSRMSFLLTNSRYGRQKPEKEQKSFLELATEIERDRALKF